MCRNINGLWPKNAVRIFVASLINVNQINKLQLSGFGWRSGGACKKKMRVIGVFFAGGGAALYKAQNRVQIQAGRLPTA